MNPERHVSVSVHASELHNQLSQFLRKALADHLTNEKDLPFVVGYSGGSMPKTLISVFEEVFEPKHQPIVRLFPVDERLVPIDHADNNTGIYLHQLTPLKNQFAARRLLSFFTRNLLNGVVPTVTKWPRINVLFLGMGPDGHTCSLFPNHPLLKESKKWTVPIEDSPKPPPRRITITVPVVNAAQHVAFIVLGEEKADVLEKIIVQKSTEFPVGLIKMQNGSSVNFFLDDKAASKVVNSEEDQSFKVIGHL
ncbi:6-phosphogluconolactonase [Aphelenchoides bicaudatus]|nr:6-phosphogluconolactonase [Aphelenchoides bicaudatus]